MFTVFVVYWKIYAVNNNFTRPLVPPVATNIISGHIFMEKFENFDQISTPETNVHLVPKISSRSENLRFTLEIEIWSRWCFFLYGHWQNFAFPHHNPHFPADNPIGILNWGILFQITKNDHIFIIIQPIQKQMNEACKSCLCVFFVTFQTIFWCNRRRKKQLIYLNDFGKVIFSKTCLFIFLIFKNKSKSGIWGLWAVLTNII